MSRIRNPAAPDLAQARRSHGPRALELEQRETTLRIGFWLVGAIALALALAIVVLARYERTLALAAAGVLAISTFVALAWLHVAHKTAFIALKMHSGDSRVDAKRAYDKAYGAGTGATWLGDGDGGDGGD
jgi:predicted lysophospholipase L1 biosynthesis ABC-type transport system permease subunit